MQEEEKTSPEYERFQQAIDKFDALMASYQDNDSAEAIQNLKLAYDEVVKRRYDYQASLPESHELYRARKPEWERFQDAIDHFDSALDAFNSDELKSGETLANLRLAYYELLQRGIDYKATIEKGHEFVDAITINATRSFDKALGNVPPKASITIYDVTNAFRIFVDATQKASEEFNDANKINAHEKYSDLQYLAEKCLKNNKDLTETTITHIKELMSMASLLLSSAYQTAFTKEKKDGEVITLGEETAKILEMDIVTWKDEDFQADEIREQNKLWTDMIAKLFGEDSEMTFFEYKNRLWDLENSMSKKYGRPLPPPVNVDLLKLMKANANSYCKAVLSKNKNDIDRYKAMLVRDAVIYIENSDDIPKHYEIVRAELQTIFDTHQIFDFDRLIVGIGEYFNIKELSFNDVYRCNTELTQLVSQYTADKSDELKIKLTEKHDELHKISSKLLEKESTDRGEITEILKKADSIVNQAKELSFHDFYRCNTELTELASLYTVKKSAELKDQLFEKHKELYNMSMILLEKGSPHRDKITPILKNADMIIQQVMEVSKVKSPNVLSFLATKKDPTNTIRALANTYCTQNVFKNLAAKTLVANVIKYMKKSNDPQQAYEHFRSVIDEVVKTHNQDKSNEKKIDPSTIYQRIEEEAQVKAPELRKGYTPRDNSSE